MRNEESPEYYMKIIFMGTPAFAVPSLEKLLSKRHTIAAVVTVPDKPRGRGLHLAESEVKKFSLSQGLRVLQPATLRDEKFKQEIENLKPDLIVVVAFRILPKEIFSVSRFGSVNLHASLLPKYRGAAPINWAIIKGEKETGVTTFFLKEKVDTGNIILQKQCQISDEDTAGSLHDKLSILGAELVCETVDLIESTNGNIEVTAQDEGKASPAPKITPEMCKINWKDAGSNVHNFIRGLSPYPGAYTFHNETKIKIFNSQIPLSWGVRGVFPGSIQTKGGKLFVGCNDGLVQILELQLEGRKRLTAEEFLRGHRFKENDKFE
jgi:methionyl-tRNA formyltransferase